MEPKVQNEAFKGKETLELPLPVADQSSPVADVEYGVSLTYTIKHQNFHT